MISVCGPTGLDALPTSRRDFLGLVGAGLTLGAIPCAFTQSGVGGFARQSRIVRLSQTIVASMQQLRVPGASVAILNGYELEWVQGFGVMNVSDRAPVTAATLFQAASISKVPTSVAALRLATEGKLSMDQPINDKLVSWKVAASSHTLRQPVTLRHLLTHSAGFTVHGFEGYEPGQPLPSLIQILNGLFPANSRPIVVTRVPGQQSQYSGGGFCVLQQLLIDVTGMAFPALMKELVLDPLGMKSSGYSQPLPRDEESAACRGHRANGQSFRTPWHVYPELAAAGLWTTPSDLARLCLAISAAAEGRPSPVLAPAAARQMLTPQIQNQYGPMGLGVFLSGANRSTRFSHSGTNSGFQCRMTGTGGGRGAIIMTNSDAGGPLVAQITDAIALEYGWP